MIVHPQVYNITQIFDYQQRVRESKPAQQTALFNLPPTHCA
ncbi:MAG TPA: hypothetical protein V6D09_08225 [Leptolyngbyaceae cyanobacterium]